MNSTLLLGPRLLPSIDLPDYVNGETHYKRRAVVVGTSTTQDDASGEFEATIVVKLKHYASVNGEAGPPLHPVTPDEIRTLYGNNKKLVAADTGRILLERDADPASPGYQDEQLWQTLINGYPQPVQLQGDFLEGKRDAPTNQRELIEQNLYGAVLMGLFE